MRTLRFFVVLVLFGLTGSVMLEGEGRAFAAANSAAAPVPSVSPVASKGRAATGAPSREIRLGRSTPAAANDAGPGGGSRRRETKVVSSTTTAAAASAAAHPPLSRARGIGSRFRAAPARSLEKFK